MTTISDFSKRLNKVIKELPVLIKESVKENDNVIIDTITEQQLQKGIRGDGQKIGEYKNKDYQKYKKQINPQARGFVDLKLEGDFYKGFVLKEDGNFQTIYSKDEKAEKLEKKYGSEIYILTDKNHKAIVKDYILPTLQTKIKDELQLS
jgi:hypothetical protein